MFRPRHFITVVAVCMMAAGCTSRDDGESIWRYFSRRCGGGAFHARHTAEHRSGRGMRIRPVPLYIRRRRHPVGLRRSGEVDRLEPVEQLRYIYTPKPRMVIDSYGTFTVREISVEWLEGVTGSPTFWFHADTDAVPERTSCGASAQRTKEINDALKNPSFMLAAIPALCPLQSCDATNEEALLNDLTEGYWREEQDENKLLVRFSGSGKSFLHACPARTRPAGTMHTTIHPSNPIHNTPSTSGTGGSACFPDAWYDILVLNSTTLTLGTDDGETVKFHQGPGRIRYRHVPEEYLRQTPGNLSGKLTEPKK